MVTMEQRFWAKVNKGGECWQWTASKNHKGYGVFSAGKLRSAHRVAYEIAVGPIPDGLDLDHTCHTEAVKRGECEGGDACPHRACVNPAHLEPVTKRENWERSLSVSNLHATKTHCPKGHPYTGENLYVAPRGDGDTFRSCRACHYEASRKWHAKKRAERARLAEQKRRPGEVR